jgi:hypothetical protein
MEKSKGGIRRVALAFVFTEATLGILVQLASGDLKRILCFSSVALSLVFSIIILDKSSKRIATATALFFTVLSDAFLVLCSPPERIVAMLSFSIVQICYFLRLYLNTDEKRVKMRHLLVRCILVFAFSLSCALVLLDKCDLLSLISVFYFANLLTNLIFAFLKKDESILFPIGLLCFALCDAFVGFSVMSEVYFEFAEGSLLYNLANPPLDLVWLFYVPSQTLIPLSLITKKQG